MYHLLVPVDRDRDRTTVQADFVVDFPVEPDDLSVTVLQVLPWEEADTVTNIEFNDNEAAVKAANRIEGYGISVTRKLATGEPVADRILEAARKHDVDQIVIAGRQRSPVKKAVLGSTAADIIRDARLPVVVAG